MSKWWLIPGRVPEGRREVSTVWTGTTQVQTAPDTGEASRHPESGPARLSHPRATSPSSLPSLPLQSELLVTRTRPGRSHHTSRAGLSQLTSRRLNNESGSQKRGRVCDSPSAKFLRCSVCVCVGGLNGKSTARAPVIKSCCPAPCELSAPLIYFFLLCSLWKRSDFCYPALASHPPRHQSLDVAPVV